MGSAALAAAVPYSAKTIRISRKGHRRTHPESLNFHPNLLRYTEDQCTHLDVDLVNADI